MVRVAYVYCHSHQGFQIPINRDVAVAAIVYVFYNIKKRTLLYSLLRILWKELMVHFTKFLPRYRTFKFNQTFDSVLIEMITFFAFSLLMSSLVSINVANIQPKVQSCNMTFITDLYPLHT